MSNLPSISQIRQAVTPIAQKYGLKRLYLFGSYAKGNATPDSDVDLVSISGIDEAFWNEVRGTEVLLYVYFAVKCVDVYAIITTSRLH